MLRLTIEQIRHGGDCREVGNQPVLISEIHDVDGTDITLRCQAFVRSGDRDLRGMR